MADPDHRIAEFDEIARVIDALRATDANRIAIPADWNPGDCAIVAMAVSTEDARETSGDVDGLEPDLRYVDAPCPVPGASAAALMAVRVTRI